MTLYIGWLIAAALCYMLLNALANFVYWPRLDDGLQPLDLPTVSILIPARDEAPQIATLVQQLLSQSYASFQVLLLDDQSSDETAACALNAANGDERFRLLHGAELPCGWLGKNWACHQLAQAVEGEIIIFTDADVRWRPNALRAIVAQFQQYKVDALSVWPTQETVTWAERLTVPLVVLSVLAYAPMWFFNRANVPGTGVANGQCMVFWRRAYWQIGGHAGVRNAIVEDVVMAQLLKRSRLWLRNVDANGLLRCRMYQDWPEVLAGFGKNILAGHVDSVTFLIGSTIFHWAVFVLPWWWLVAGWGAPLLSISLIVAGLLARGLTARATGQRVADALLMPLSVLLMTRIALQGLYWRWFGDGPVWKGRVLEEQVEQIHVAPGS